MGRRNKKDDVMGKQGKLRGKSSLKELESTKQNTVKVLEEDKIL
jgi:hypothetical protein